jgi:hypothetical protein
VIENIAQGSPLTLYSTTNYAHNLLAKSIWQSSIKLQQVVIRPTPPYRRATAFLRRTHLDRLNLRLFEFTSRLALAISLFKKGPPSAEGRPDIDVFRWIAGPAPGDDGGA